MAQTSHTSSATGNARILTEAMAKRYGITRDNAARLMAKYLDRETKNHLVAGWWVDLLDAQFQTHIGPHPRVRCGDETHMAHLTPDAGELCHDCGCVLGEYHVFGCDAEECSRCGQQAMCCDCPDGSEQAS